MSTKNLLIVDDSATTADAHLTDAQEERSYRIVEASDGADAVEKLGSQGIRYRSHRHQHA